MAAEEFKNRNLTGSRFEHVDLSEVRIHDAALRDVRISGAWIMDLVIDGEIEGSLTVNGVDLLPALEAELNRRYPGREAIYAVMAGDADSFREAMRVLDGAWPSTIERLRRLPPTQLHERVDEQWSAVENIRHLVFAIDSWAKRALLGDAAPYDPLDLPHTEMGEVDGVPNDLDARPSLDEVLALHEDRLAVVRGVIEGLTDERLAETTEPNTAPGYPEPQAYEVRRCLAACVIEEWEHRRYIERDLDRAGAR
jgi:DinB superfamily